jgi:hypothetical protein
MVEYEPRHRELAMTYKTKFHIALGVSAFLLFIIVWHVVARVDAVLNCAPGDPTAQCRQLAFECERFVRDAR